MKFRLIEDQRDTFKVRAMCDVILRHHIGNQFGKRRGQTLVPIGTAKLDKRGHAEPQLDKDLSSR